MFPSSNVAGFQSHLITFSRQVQDGRVTSSFRRRPDPPGSTITDQTRRIPSIGTFTVEKFHEQPYLLCAPLIVLPTFPL